MNTLISIVIPIYNSEIYLSETLKSIKKQTYPFIEVIMIDDGSTDSSLTICKQYLNDRRFKLIQQKNEGAPSARNNGLKNAKGDYIIFFDSDDIMKENSIEQMVNLIEQSKSDLLISNYGLLIDGTYTNYDYLHYKKVKKINQLFFISPFPINKLYKTSFLKQNNIVFDNVKIGQDFNFFLKTLPLIKKYTFLNILTTYYRITPNSISRKYNSNILDIVKSKEYIEIFYKQNNIHKNYFQYLYRTYLNHLLTQLNKLFLFESFVESKKCFYVLNKEFISTIHKISILNKLNISFFKAILKYIIFRMKFFLFLRKEGK